MKKIVYIILCAFITINCFRDFVTNLTYDIPQVEEFLTTFEPLPESFRAPYPKVNYKVLVYMEADNDLYPFALKDLKEMMMVGSNENLTILVQFDGLGEKAFTKRLLVQKNKIYEVEKFDHKADGGSAQTLIDFCTWAHTEYPSEHTILVFWNHGSGVLDPSRGRPFSSAQLFNVNPITNLLELDRSIGFFEYLERRGICFSDTYGTYLTNQKLEQALDTIVKFMGKKLDIIAFDACLMSMIEIADYARFFADYMVASEEVEPGTGWNYHMALSLLASSAVKPEDAAKHLVESYRQSYLPVTRDFTQSALDLKKITPLLNTLHKISSLIMKALEVQINGTVETSFLHAIDDRHCTRFAEPSYADLGHFLKNLKLVLPYMTIQSGNTALISQLKKLIDDALTLLNQVVIANGHGSNFSHVSGLAVYFPLDYLSSSYQKTHFYKENAWGSVLNYFFLR